MIKKNEIKIRKVNSSRELQHSYNEGMHARMTQYTFQNLAVLRVNDQFQVIDLVRANLYTSFAFQAEKLEHVE